MDDDARAEAARFTGGRLALLLYGAIVAATALAIAGAHLPAPHFVVLAILGSLTIYWLSHVYVHTVAEHVAVPGEPLRHVVWTSFRNETPLLLGGLPTAAVYVAAILLSAEMDTATLVALWFTVGLLGATGYAAGRRAGATGWRLAAESLVAAGFGLVAVGLKIAMH